MYIDDCVQGTQAIMARDILDPINLGSDELVTISLLSVGLQAARFSAAAWMALLSA